MVSEQDVMNSIIVFSTPPLI